MKIENKYAKDSGFKDYLLTEVSQKLIVTESFKFSKTGSVSIPLALVRSMEEETRHTLRVKKTTTSQTKRLPSPDGALEREQGSFILPRVTVTQMTVVGNLLRLRPKARRNAKTMPN